MSNQQEYQPEFVPLSAHIKRVMYALVNAEQPLRALDIAAQAKCSSRQIYYDLQSINYLLKMFGIPPIQHHGELYYFSCRQAEQVSSLLSKTIRIAEKDNRTAYIICMLLASPSRFTIDFLSNSLGVSRNTVLSDISWIRQTLSCYQLELKNEKKAGYYIHGLRYNRYYVFLRFLIRFLKSSHYAFLDFFPLPSVEDTIRRVSSVFAEYGLSVKRREILAVSLFILFLRQESTDLPPAAPSWLCETKLFFLVSKFFPDEAPLFSKYITLLLLSFCPEKDKYAHISPDCFESASSRFVDLAGGEAGLQLADPDGLRCELACRFAFANLCFQYSLPVVNIFVDDVQKNYSDLYSLACSLCSSISPSLPFPLWDSEIASACLDLLIHNLDSRCPSVLRVVLLCNNNEQISRFLSREICSLSSRIQIAAIIHSPSELLSAPAFDLVVSAQSLTADVPLIRIHTIITSADKQKILQYLRDHLPQPL